MDDPKVFGKRTLMPVLTRLKAIREAHNEERMDLVRDLEVSYQVLQKWETDILHQLDTNILHAVMERYGVTYEQLIYKATPRDIARIEREKADRATKREAKSKDDKES